MKKHITDFRQGKISWKEFITKVYNSNLYLCRSYIEAESIAKTLV